MKMKEKNILITVCVVIGAIGLLVLSGCGGGKDIQGKWYIQRSDGSTGTMTVTDKTIDLGGKVDKYVVSAKGFKNQVWYYVLQESLKSNSRMIVIVFPEKGDKNTALIIKPDNKDNYLKGTMIWAMHREKTPDYQEFANKYMK